MSLAEPFVKPSTMLYRNFLAMEAEELLRCHPIDGAVLLGGCDKTTPGLIMGAISMGVPAIYVPAGPMLRGNWHGQYLGSGSDAWKYWMEKQAGNITDAQWEEMEAGISRSFGTCMVMGTAATMMAITEALGLTLPGASSIPAADSGASAHVRRGRPAHRRHGVGGSHARPHPDAGRIRQRHQGPHGARRLDQCHHPRGGDGAPRRPQARHAALRRDFARHPGDRQYPPVGQIPDGGFLLRRRPARADDGAQGPARPLVPDGDRAAASARTSRVRKSTCRTSFTRSPIRSTAKARPPCSPAIWRRAAA